MVDDFDARFAHEWDAVARELNGSLDREGTKEAVTRGVRRRRRVRAGLTSLAVIVAVPIVAVTAYAVLEREAPAPALTPSPSTEPSETPSPSPSGSSSPSPAPSPSPSASATAEPELGTWDVPESERPPLIEDQDPREPAAREMQDWVWDHVDDAWKLEIFSDGTGDREETFADIQTMFLLAPDGDRFRLYTLRTDYELRLSHVDLDSSQAWIYRLSRGDSAQIVQFDVKTGTTTEDWGDGAIPASNYYGDSVTHVSYGWTLSNDREVWLASTYYGIDVGLFFREPSGEFTASPTVEEWQKVLDTGYSTGQREPTMWLDRAGERAVYVPLAKGFGSEVPDDIDMRWRVHDLAEDTSYRVAPRLPADLTCSPPGNEHSNEFDGDWVVVVCKTEDTRGFGDDFYWIDLTGKRDPRPLE